MRERPCIHLQMIGIFSSQRVAPVHIQRICALIEKPPALKMIATPVVGYDRIPVEFAHSREIAVTKTSADLDSAVCELAVGLLLSLLRQSCAADRHVKTKSV